MNKIFTKVATLSIGLAMAIGVGVAVGSKEAARVDASSSITFTAGSDVGTGASVSKDGITMSATSGDFSRTDNYRPYANATFTVSSTIGNITAMTFNCNASGSNKGGPGVLSTTNGTYSASGQIGTWSGDSASISFSCSKQCQINSAVITYVAATVVEATTLTITASPTTVYAGEQISIKGDLSGGSGAYEKTISWNSNNTSVVANPSNSEDGDSFVITPNSVASQTDVTLTGTVVSPGSATNSVVLTIKPARTLTSITVSGDMENKDYNKNAPWNYTGLSILGHYSDNSESTIGTFNELIQAGTLSFTASPAKATVGTKTLTLSNITYDEKTVQGGHVITGISVADVEVDVLTTSTFGSPSGYTTWSNKKASTDAVYAGNSNTYSSTAIQIRAEQNSGIVSTTSAGVVSKVVVDWHSSTTSGRTLNVFGKDTAYTASSDLYSNNTKGELLGSIVKGTSTELVISPENQHEYIGLVSSNGAMYLNSITIYWSAPTPVVTELTLSPSDETTVKVGSSQTFTINVTGKNLTGSETASVTYTPVELTASAIELSAGSVSANGGTFTLTAITADAAGTLKVTCLGVDSNSVDIYTEEAKELSSIAITSEGTKGYIAGQTFSTNGFVVTATYSDMTTSQVQNAASWNVLRSGSLLDITSELAKGDLIRISYQESGVTKTADIELSIIEAIANIDGIVEGYKTITKACSELGIPNASEIDNVVISDNVTIDGDIGTNGNNPPKYYENGHNIRAYAGNTITISSDNAITGIVFTMTSGYEGDISVDSGTYSLNGLVGTWTGSANSVVFTTSANWRFEDIAVTYYGSVEGNISNQYYEAQRVVLEFSKYLTDTLDEVCIMANYSSDEFIAQWDLVAQKFEDKFVDNEESLDATNLSIAKQLLKGAVGNYSGDTLQKAVARYDKIVSESDLPAFMLDGSTPLRAANNIRFAIQNSSATLIIIVASIVCLTAIGGYFLFKKKKQY